MAKTKAGRRPSRTREAPAVVTPKQGLIASQYATDDGQRTELLDRARLCAALSKPWLLPPVGHLASSKLPEAYQSLGSRGLATMEGKMLLALFPPDQPWFTLEPAPKIRFELPPDVYQK